MLLQPTDQISLGLDISYFDFYQDEDHHKIYDYTTYRCRTVFQLNKFLFSRSIIEYNTYCKRINADFLISFTYISISGTVIYLDYGSV